MQTQTPGRDNDASVTPLAMSAGPALPCQPDMPQNLAAVLHRAAQQHPDHGVTYIRPDDSDRVQSYPALLAESEQILAGLRALGLTAQDKIIFQFDSNQDYIPAFWGCMLGGFVPAPVATAPVYEPANAVVQKLAHTWEMLNHPIIFTNRRLAPALYRIADQMHLPQWRIVTIEDLRDCEGDSHWHPSQPEDLAVLLFTSGSTGIPKGVMLTHHNILSNVAASAQINQFSHTDISLNWLHLDHVGSLVRCCIRDVYVGSQQIHAPSNLVLENPLRLLDWIDHYRVTFAWGPNFFLGLVNDQAQTIQQRQWDLTCLRSMLSVAEAIVPETARRFAQLLTPFGLSSDKMHSAWGMSETGAAVTFSHRYLLELALEDAPYVEVGAPTPGFQMRIVDGQDQVIPEGEIGRLQITGPMIISGYYQNPDLNAEVFTADGWLKTGDLGCIRQGRLTITGREKDLIIINGLNHYSYELEAVVETVDGVEVSYTAACALRQPGQNTDQLLIFFHTPITEEEAWVNLLKTIRSTIVREVGISPAYLIPVSKETIPKTSIGKIQRLKLKQQFEAGAFDALVAQVEAALTVSASQHPLKAPETETESILLKHWQEILDLTAIGTQDNFFELGGSSILAVRLFAVIEQEFGRTLPPAILFDAPTIAQLAKLLDSEAPSHFQNGPVLLKPGTSKPPLFLVHDVFGETILYLNLARRLEAERPVYALRPYGRPGFPIMHTRIAEMVSYYIDQIRQIQPQGPYYLGGLCAGGVLAFEIACQLQAQGQAVALVALIDATDVQAPPPVVGTAGQRLNSLTTALEAGETRSKLARLTYLLQTVARKAKNVISYEVQLQTERVQNQIKMTLYRYHLDRGMELPQFLSNIPVITVYRFARKDYSPERVYQGQLLLLRATEPLIFDHPVIDDTPFREKTSDPLFGWGHRSTAGIDVHDIPGGHSSMLQEPQVEVMADKLLTFLQRVEADQTVTHDNSTTAQLSGVA